MCGFSGLIYVCQMGVSINGRSPIAGWFMIRKSYFNGQSMDDLGVCPFQETFKLVQAKALLCGISRRYESLVKHVSFAPSYNWAVENKCGMFHWQFRIQ